MGDKEIDGVDRKMGEIAKEDALKAVIVALIMGMCMGAGIGYFSAPPKVVRLEYQNITETDFIIVNEIPRDLEDVKIIEDDNLIVFIWFDDYGGFYGRYKMVIMEVK